MYQGMSQSVGNSLVSGTVADMFSPDQRGTPMGLFTLATFLGQVTVDPLEAELLDDPPENRPTYCLPSA
jgi:sugar phosphate permease